jgi:hypothetical protein
MKEKLEILKQKMNSSNATAVCQNFQNDNFW